MKKIIITAVLILALSMPAVSFAQATSAEAIQKSITQIDQAIAKRQDDIQQLQAVKLKQIGKLELLKDQEAEVKAMVEKAAEEVAKEE